MPRDVFAEAADLLAGLRQVREDSLRVAEYSASLTVAFDHRRRDDKGKDTFEHHAVHEEHVRDRFFRLHEQEREHLVRALFHEWFSVAHHEHILLAPAAEQKEEREYLRDVLQLRQALQQEKFNEKVRRARAELDVMLVELGNASEEIQVQLREVIKNSADKRAALVSKHCDEHLLEHCMTQWCAYVSKSSYARERVNLAAKSINMVFSIQSQHWTALCIDAWSAWAEQMAERRGDSKHQSKVESIAKGNLALIFGDNEDRLLQLLVREWHTEAHESAAQAALRDKETYAEQALANESKITARVTIRCLCKGMALLFLGQLDIQNYVDAWRAISWRKGLQDVEHDLREKTLQLSMQGKSVDDAFQAWHEKAIMTLDECTIPVCFARWHYAYCSGKRASREASLEECQVVSRAVDAWTVRTRDLNTWLKLHNLVQLLEKKRTMRLRSTLQGMFRTLGIESRAGYKQKLQSDMDAARRQLAIVVSEKKGLMDDVAEVYRCAKFTDALARKCLSRWATLRNKDIAVLLLIGWRASTVLFRAARMHSDQEAQITSVRQSVTSQCQLSQNTHKQTLVSVMNRRFFRHGLVCAFHLWKLCLLIAGHAWSLENAETSWENRRDKMLQDSAFALTQTMEKHSKQLHATTLMKAFADQSEDVRLAFFSWKGLVNSKGRATQAHLCLWVLVNTAGNRFSRWLVPTSFAYWKLLVRLEANERMLDSQSEMLWLDVLSQQSHSRKMQGLGQVVSRNIDLWSLRSALLHWRRLHDECYIDKVAYDVQTQWSEWEHNTQLKLRSMASRCRALAQFGVRRIWQQQSWKAARIALKAWEQARIQSKLQTEISTREETATTSLESQRYFEDVAREQWIENCLFAKAEAERSEYSLQTFGAWKWMVASLRSVRTLAHGAGFTRADAVVDLKERQSETSNVMLTFSRWHDTTCQARCRWIRKRCKRIRAALGPGQLTESTRSTPRRSSALKQGTGATQASAFSAAAVASTPGAPAFVSAARPPIAVNQIAGTSNVPYVPTMAGASNIATPAAFPGTNSAFPTMAGASNIATPGTKSAFPTTATAAAADDFAAKLKSFSFGFGQRT